MRNPHISNAKKDAEGINIYMLCYMQIIAVNILSVVLEVVPPILELDDLSVFPII